MSINNYFLLGMDTWFNNDPYKNMPPKVYIIGDKIYGELEKCGFD